MDNLPKSSLPASPAPNFLRSLKNLLVGAAPQLVDVKSRRQAQLASALSLALMTLMAIGGIASSREDTAGDLQTFGIPVVLLFIAYLVTRTRYFAWGAFLLSAGFSASGYSAIILSNREVPVNVLLFVPISLTIASAILTWPAVFLLTGMNVATILFLLPRFGVTLGDNISGALGIVTAFGVVLSLLAVFRQSLEAEQLRELQQTNQELMEIRENLERVDERTQELNRRSAQLEASTLVARSAAMVRDLHELLDSVVNQITERFGFYQAGIFLVDTAEKFVVMQAASSEGGKQMVKRGHKLEIGRQGVVGYAAYQKRPRIVQNVAADSAYVKSPELPTTRSEVALPLIVRNRVIGVLDIQSEEEQAFKFEDVYTLQTMADQVALAIDNTILLRESQAAIQQLEALTATNTGEVWKERLQKTAKGYIYTPLGVAPLVGPLKAESDDRAKTILIPINLRGKTIGNIALKRTLSAATWVEAERDMVERVANQVALAVENARLLEESQRRAMREQKVNEFSNRFSRSLDVDALIQNAVRELHNLPQVSEVSVFISPEQTKQA